jgi:hypothetical protein
VIVSPTGIQYLVYNAYEVAGIVVLNYWQSAEEVWYVWILSPICSVVKIYPDGQVEPVEDFDE